MLISPWASEQVLIPLCVGFLLFAWYLVLQSRSFPTSLKDAFKTRVTIPMLLISAVGGAAFYAFGAFWILEAVQFFGPDGHSVAKVLADGGFAFLLGIFFAGWAIDLTRGRIREVFIVVSAIALAGLGSMNAITPDNSAMGMGLSFLAGLGLGGLYIPTAAVLMIVSPDDLLGGITGLDLAVRWMGGAVGFAVYYNFLQNKLLNVLPTNVGLAAVKAGLPITKVAAFVEALVSQNLTAILASGGTPTIIEAAQVAVVESYAEGIQPLYLISIAFTGAALLFSFFLKDIRKYMDGRVAVEIK